MSDGPITPKQLAARQALIDAVAEVGIESSEQIADMILDGLESRGFTVAQAGKTEC